jgi:hypothetical protein
VRGNEQQQQSPRGPSGLITEGAADKEQQEPQQANNTVKADNSVKEVTDQVAAEKEVSCFNLV